MVKKHLFMGLLAGGLWGTVVTSSLAQRVPAETEKRNMALGRQDQKPLAK
jgi:hypothetical protein